MPTQANNTTTPNRDSTTPAETPDEKQLDRVADEAAEKAGNTEQRYDRDHNIFTK